MDSPFLKEYQCGVEFSKVTKAYFRMSKKYSESQILGILYNKQKAVRW